MITLPMMFLIFTPVAVLIYGVIYDFSHRDLYKQDLVNPMRGYVNKRNGTVRLLPARISPEYAERFLGLTRAPQLDYKDKV